jgi:hypothetical protein
VAIFSLIRAPERPPSGRSFCDGEIEPNRNPQRLIYEAQAEQGYSIMNSRNETTVSGGTGAWKPKLFRVAYLAGSVVITIGWLIAIGWAGFLVLRLFV